MLYILLPVHNRIVTTKAFINNLLNQTFQDFRLILIDDGSTDGTSDFVQKYIPNTIIIKGKGKWWWAGALQQGYMWIKKNVNDLESTVLIINDDVAFKTDYLEKGISRLFGLNKTIVFSKVFSLQNNTLFWSGIHIDWKTFQLRPNQEDNKVNCVSTRGIFLKIKDFFEVGRFHPIVLPHYSSDYEYTHRAFKKGFSFKSYSDIILTVDENTSGYRNFHNESFFLFTKKFFSKKNPINPVYSTAFVALACPWKYKMINFLRIVKVTFSVFIKNFVSEHNT
jgi:GT2 family glycosyltransferase